MADQETLEVSSTGFHNRYDFQDGDVVLESSDKVKFRLHSVFLKQSSSVFRDMIELAQPSNDVVPVAEPSELMALLLDYIYPLDAPSLPKPATLKVAVKLGEIADKYNIPRVIASLRAVLHEEKYRKSPIDLYALACRWKWPEIAAIASTETLLYDLGLDQCLEKMQQLNAADLCKLLKLHNRRKKQIMACLDKPRSHDIDGCAQITQCTCIVDRMVAGEDRIIDPALGLAEDAHRRMQEIIFMRLHRRPLGDLLISASSFSDLFQEAHDIKCPYCGETMLPIADVTTEIQQLVGKEAVRSVEDIKD